MVMLATAISLAALLLGMVDASVGDFPRLDGETGDSSRIMRAVNAAGKGGVVWFPRGEYEIDLMLVVTNSSSLLLHKSAHLKAVSEMPFVLKYEGRTPGDHNLFIKGGDVDGNGLAGCAHVAGFRHFTMSDTTFRNGKGVGLQCGDPNVDCGYEIVACNLYFICYKQGLAGNVGLLTYIGDSHFTDIVVVDYTTGIRDMKWSNRFTRCHVWGAKPEMLKNSVAFDLRGADAVLTDCYADTSMTGFLVKNAARVFNCGYFNNWVFKMDNPTVFRHECGRLVVTGGQFSKCSPNATLYSCCEKAGELVWRDNSTGGFSEKEMAVLSRKLGKPASSGASAVLKLAE